MRPQLIETAKRGGALGPIDIDKHSQRGKNVRHILTRLELS